MLENIKKYNHFEGTVANEASDKKYSNNERKGKTKGTIFANVFSLQNVPLYIVALMISIVGVGNGTTVSPFSISIMAACMGSSVPILGVVLAGLIGNAIGFGIEGSLTYLITSLVFVVSTLLWKPLYQEEEKNEKIKLAKNVFITTLIVQLAKIGFKSFTVYDILSVISFSMIAVVFYKVFVNSIIVFQGIGERRAYSIEEVLGASLLLAISVTCFGNLSIFGFSIRNILSILIVLVLGWKNGVLVGTTAGVTIGVTLGVITEAEPLMVAAYAISGMCAGILNKFGKIGVIIGFCLGNVVLAYVSNGYTVELIYFKEILIASIGLLAVPKTIEINIEEFMGNSKFLPTFPNRALNQTKETAEKLNNVSETINQMAKTYAEVEEQNEEQGEEDNKQIFITELLDNLRGYENNMLYDDLSDAQGKIDDQIFKVLVDKQEIKRQDILKIFADCNSYIIGFEDRQISSFLEENIAQMVRVINMSYKISKSSFVWQKKMEQNKKNMKEQLNGVSKAISNLAQDIEKDVENEGQYEKEKVQILELLKQKGVGIQEISIKRQERFLIEIYIEDMQKTKIEIIEKILSDILREKIVLNEEASLGNRLNFLSDDKYVMAIGTADSIKSKSNVSGDSVLNIRLKDGKYLIAISDGMGSGKVAKESSNKALKMLENLLLAGFQKETSLEFINTSLINQNKEVFATLDIAIVDLYKGNIEFIKSGACPTYIKNGKKVQVLKANSLPAGIVPNANLHVYDKDISSGEIMVMCTDGVLDSNVEYKNKELWLRYLLEDIETTNTKKIADILLNEAIDNTYGVVKDDMSIIVCRFLEK